MRLLRVVARQTLNAWRSSATHWRRRYRCRIALPRRLVVVITRQRPTDSWRASGPTSRCTSGTGKAAAHGAGIRMSTGVGVGADMSPRSRTGRGSSRNNIATAPSLSRSPGMQFMNATRRFRRILARRWLLTRDLFTAESEMFQQFIGHCLLLIQIYLSRRLFTSCMRTAGTHKKQITIVRA